MEPDTKTILCGTCKVAVKGPANPEPKDVITCPSCGKSDSFENVMASVQAFVHEASSRYLNEALRETARGSKMLEFSGKPIPKGNHPFFVDLKL